MAAAVVIGEEPPTRKVAANGQNFMVRANSCLGAALAELDELDESDGIGRIRTRTAGYNHDGACSMLKAASAEF